ncbi:MAG: hypothetical protein MPJ50_09720 [Pirellulales bacterium]|nr:hypothetical protein [Pirellulales bacterium]
MKQFRCQSVAQLFQESCVNKQLTLALSFSNRHLAETPHDQNNPLKIAQPQCDSGQLDAAWPAARCAGDDAPANKLDLAAYKESAT